MQIQPSYRTERINELIRRELARLLRQETKDQRLNLVRVTEVIVSKDLSSAKVFYTVADDKKSVVEPLLNKAGGFFRSRLSKNIDLRHTPALKFVYDSAPNTGDRIETLLSGL